ncbi:MAG: aminoacyl-histidine dipeptidase [Dysgonamonadaceae bacterium]|jgi:dipeptidase D|nr:aminoacyl-histidine dipeptidase [Dysgonamonadaceae bacterium]
MEIKDLTHIPLWYFFDKINKVPRPSEKESKITEFIVKFAKKCDLQYKTDNAGNVLIKKTATRGMENRKPVILQSHLDMVCIEVAELKGKIDFDKDAINTYVENGYVKAKGTTLGADNGIGVAAQLALLASDDIAHGPVECLFTTAEETGLYGAKALDKSYLSGANILLNLDSEDFGEFCIGCAGGRNTQGVFKYKKTVAPEDYYWFKVKVSGLLGGHSGCQIDLGRGNSIKIITRYLYPFLSQKLLLANIEGGEKHNAIPNSASAVAGIPKSYKEKAVEWLNILQAAVSTELKKVDKDVKLTMETIDEPKFCIDYETGNKLLTTLCAIPHGVIGMNHDMKNLVETSTNLAIIKTDTTKNTVEVLTSQRSSSETMNVEVCNQVYSVLSLGGAKVTGSDGYSSWKPNKKSNILKLSTSTYKNLFGKRAAVRATHGGLECGLFLGLNPKLDQVSFGPTIHNAHTPKEEVEIESVEKFWRFLVELLKLIPAA